MEKIKIFRFKVEHWDNFNSQTEEDKGFVSGVSYGDVVSKIESFYGSDYNIYEIDIYELDTGLSGVLLDSDIDEININEEK